MSIDNLPVVELKDFLSNPTSEEGKKTCAQVVKILRETSCLIIRDPRVTFQDNETFIDMMEDYYNLPFEEKLKDARPEWSYQVGATPEKTEV